MLRLWGRLSSINVRTVVWAAQELGLPLQRTDAGGQFGLVREAAYLQRNVRPKVDSITVHPPGVAFQKPFSTGEARPSACTRTAGATPPICIQWNP